MSTSVNSERPAATEFPTPETTGVPAGTQLLLNPGDLVAKTPKQVIDGMRVTGDIRVVAQDVVIRNTEVLGRVVNNDGKGEWRYTIEDSTIGRPDMCYSTGEGAIGIDQYTARRVQIHGFPDGFRVSGDNVRIEDSFVSLCGQPDSHADGIQGYGGGQGVVIAHNTIDARVSQGENAAIFFADGSRQAEVRDNLLIGGGYTLRLHDETNHKVPADIASYIVTGNRVAEGDYGFGPASVDDCDKRRAIIWSDNTLVTVDKSYVVTAVGAPIKC